MMVYNAKMAEQPALDYIRDPERIHAESLARIRAEVALDSLPPGINEVALRLIYATGETDLLADLAWSDGVVGAVRQALGSGTPILTDSDMVAHGLIRSRLKARNPVHCFLNSEEAGAIGRGQNLARPAASVDLWRPHLAGAVAVIGTAAVALYRLLELIDAGVPKPAAILAFPVGFVGAEEAKQALIDNPRGVPYLLLRGRRGGSAMATAALNALTGLAPPSEDG